MRPVDELVGANIATPLDELEAELAEREAMYKPQALAIEWDYSIAEKESAKRERDRLSKEMTLLRTRINFQTKDLPLIKYVMNIQRENTQKETKIKDSKRNKKAAETRKRDMAERDIQIISAAKRRPASWSKYQKAQFIHDNWNDLIEGSYPRLSSERIRKLI